MIIFISGLHAMGQLVQKTHANWDISICHVDIENHAMFVHCRHLSSPNLANLVKYLHSNCQIPTLLPFLTILLLFVFHKKLVDGRNFICVFPSFLFVLHTCTSGSNTFILKFQLLLHFFEFLMNPENCFIVQVPLHLI